MLASRSSIEGSGSSKKGSKSTGSLFSSASRDNLRRGVIRPFFGMNDRKNSVESSTSMFSLASSAVIAPRIESAFKFAAWPRIFRLLLIARGVRIHLELRSNRHDLSSSCNSPGYGADHDQADSHGGGSVFRLT